VDVLDPGLSFAATRRRERVEVVARREWERPDRAMSSNAGPHAFGLAAAVLDELRSERHPLAHRLAEGWANLTVPEAT
jgi:hypothetical protein